MPSRQPSAPNVNTPILAPNCRQGNLSRAYKPEQHDLALVKLRRAVELEPGNSDALADLALALVFSGEPREALSLMDRAKRQNPNVPNWYLRAAGLTAYFVGDYRSAIQDFARWIETDRKSGSEAKAWIVAASGQANDPDKAAHYLEAYRAELRPGVGSEDFTAEALRYSYAFKRQEDEDRFIEGLIKGGWKTADD